MKNGYNRTIVGKENFNFTEAKILSVAYMKEPYETDRKVEYGGVKQRTVAGGSQPAKIEDIKEEEMKEIIKNIVSEFKGYENKNISTRQIKKIFSKYGKVGNCGGVDFLVCELEKRFSAKVEIEEGQKLNEPVNCLSLFNVNALDKHKKKTRTMLLSFGEYAELDGMAGFVDCGSFAKIEYKIIK